MPIFDKNALARHYETLTDAKLVSLQREGGLTEEAGPLLSNEIARRNLKPGDLEKRRKVSRRIALREEAKEWGFGGKGPGLRFFGRHYLNQADREANVQLRTKWFTVGGIPLIPLASYRFKCTGDPGRWFHWDTEQRVLDRVPLNWTQVMLTWIKTVIIIVVASLLWVGFVYYREWGRP